MNDVLDTVEIAYEDDVIISNTVATHHDLKVTCRILKVVQDNEEEISHTNQVLIALSNQRH